MQKIIKNQLGFSPDLFVYQDKNMFNYSVDTVLLGNFISLGRGIDRILEIGTNNGALAIFVASRKKTLHIDAIEIQEEALELAKKNVELNKMNDQISLQCIDFNLFWKQHNKMQNKKYDAIVCNPPFYKVGAGAKRSQNPKIHIATHETHINLEQIIEGSAKIIKQKGSLALVIPIERLVDCFELLRKYHWEPKRVQSIHSRTDEKANLVLIESYFRTGWGTEFLPNLYLHPDDKKTHVYRNEIIKLYTPIKNKEKNE